MNNDQQKHSFIAAIRAGDVRKVKALLARHRWLRENINASWHHFDSPIIFCAERNPKMIDALLAAGADINARKTLPRTPPSAKSRFLVAHNPQCKLLRS